MYKYFLNKKIAIVTLFDSNYLEISKYSIQNKLAYCKKYGYDFHYFDEYLNKTQSWDWNKMSVVHRILETNKYEWVWWINIDSIILNFEIRLDTILDNECQMIFTKNHDNIITTDSCFFKNTNLVKNFIKDFYNLNYRCVKNEISDQYSPTISDLLKSDANCSSITKLVNERVCNSNCKSENLNSANLTINQCDVYQDGDFLIQFKHQTFELKFEYFLKYLLPKKITIVLFTSDENVVDYQKNILSDSRYDINYHMPKLINKTNYISYSSLINECINYVDDEFIIFVNPKVVPNKNDVDTIIKNLHLGYALVTRIHFGLFGTTKELFRSVGLFDERFIGGEYEDTDLFLRLKLNNLAGFYEYDRSRYIHINSPSLYDKNRGISQSIFNEKWKKTHDCKIKINKKDLHIKLPFNKLNIQSNIKYYWNEFSQSFIDSSVSNDIDILGINKYEILVDDVERQNVKISTIYIKIKKNIDSIVISYGSDTQHSELLFIQLINVSDPKIIGSGGFAGNIPINQYWGTSLNNSILYELRLYFKERLLYSNILKDNLDLSMEYNVFI